MTCTDFRFSTIALLSALAMSACSSSHNGDEDGGVRPDGSILPDGGGRPDVPSMACGDETCEASEICCAGCPGAPPLGCFAGGCPPIACPEEWTVCEAALVGATAGEPCSFEGSCSEDEGRCCSRFVECDDGALRFETACAPGCFACASNDDCASGSYCDFEALGCGGPGTCLPRPDACTDDCPGVCSCDGETFCNACDAHVEGQSVAHLGSCGEPTCEAQDARAEGECALFLGYVWDGESCRGIGGCTCVGSDCDTLSPSMEECEGLHAVCGGSSCDAMDARGTGLCDGFFGYGWDGTGCYSITGCSCVGADCDEAYESPDACRAAHAGCGPEGCAEQVARGVGGCRVILGYRWNGRTACEAVSGCTCEGEGCDSLYDEQVSCERAHADCVDF